MGKIKVLVKKHGWKGVVGILAYYIIRDVTLYILIPAFLLN